MDNLSGTALYRQAHNGRNPGGSTPLRHVLIGNGVAAIFAAEAIRNMDPAASITMISDEEAPAYSRCLTPDLIAGHLPEERLWIRPPDFYERLKIRGLFGCRVTQVDPDQQVVTLSDGRAIPFDRLLVASGAAPVMPEIPGIRRPGVFGLRTLADARGIAAIAATARRAVVVGGGLVSLKAA
ncbi:MAG: FAD-dependent oxidoreductase, partial [Syntrophothermus sp.]